MKKTYIAPEVDVIMINAPAVLLPMSVYNTEVEDGLAPIFDDLDEEFFK